MRHHFLTLLIFLTLTLIGKAHQVEQIYMELTESGADWRLQVTMDAAYSLPEYRNDKDEPQPARQWLLDMSETGHQRLRHETEKYLRACLRLTYNGQALDYTFVFPDYAASPPDFPQLLNDGAYLTVILSPLEKTTTAGEFAVHVSETAAPNFIVAIPTDSEKNFIVISPGEQKVIFETDATGTTHSHGSIWSIILLGYEHVLPYGLDHVLFILGLFLLARAWKPLLAQSLAFTVAHSLTLGLVISGWMPVADWKFAWLIEPLIALSIVIVAGENLWAKKPRPHRLFIVFGFGLIHGMGFAGSLGSVLRTDEGAWLIPLVAANIGVELAQVTLLAAAWLLTMKWCEKKAYTTFRKAASLAIVTIGLWMTLERLLP